MGMRDINARNLRLMMESKGRAWTEQHLSEALQKRELRPEDFSIRDLAVGLICRKDGTPCGEDWFRDFASPRGGFRNLTEAANAVDTSAFSGITGQLAFNKVLEGYQHADFLYPELMTVVPTTFLQGERMPGIGEVGDVFDAVNEGQAYPTIGINEEFIDTPALVKRGGILPVTREIILADRTGILLDRAASGGKGLGYNLERRALDVVTGVVNNYKRNTASTNTFLTSGSYVNSQSNPLVDHTDVENAEVLLAAITDPNTGLYITQESDTILVPLELKKTALRIVNATEVAVVDNQANAGTHRQWSEAPKTLYDKRFSTLKVLSSPFVKERTSSASTWFYGNFKKSFGRTVAWDITPAQMGETSEAAFTSDTFMRYKVSVMDACWVLNPRHVAKNT